MRAMMVLMLLVCSVPAHAVNQMYQQGFNDGISYQHQVCQNTMRQNVARLQQENAYLRDQLRRQSAQQQVDVRSVSLSGESGVQSLTDVRRNFDMLDD